MCACQFLINKAKTMAPTEQLVVDRQWIEWVLTEHRCTCAASGVSSDHVQPASAVGYGVAELAELFEKAHSTIRTWCAARVFGDPETLKSNGKDWSVPQERVDGLLEKLAEGYQITAKGLRKPESRARESKEDGGSSGSSPRPPVGSKQGRGSKTPKSGSGWGGDKARKHNEWRQHVRQR